MLSALFIAACAALSAPGAHAQQAATPADGAASAAPTVQRVVITGSAIQRVDAEAALPVHVIRREDIVKAGVTTAAELVARVAASSKGLSDGGSIQSGGFHDQTGFNSVNLRGVGTSSTLVLLNGRRMANFASPGDDAGVDLNTLPAAAIERVEILLDGASAIYGTDAIAGVMNFITRSDYQGAEINAYAGASQEGGAGKRNFSLAGGVGDMATQGFNAVAVLDVQHTDALRATQRQFIADLDIATRLPHLLSGVPYPANVVLSAAQRDLLIQEGYAPNGRDVISQLVINPLGTACNPPHSLYIPNGVGGKDACSFDYMRDTELYPESRKLGLLARGSLALSGDHQLFAELSATQATTLYVSSATRAREKDVAKIDAANVPGLNQTGLATLPNPADRLVGLRLRLMEAGGRQTKLVSTGQRLVLGGTGSWNLGSLGSWDYDSAVVHAVNSVADQAAGGYVLKNALSAAIQDGRINPFGPSSAAGLAALNDMQVVGTVRQARGTLTGIDVKVSSQVGHWAAGPVGVAAGAELRREAMRFTPSALLLSNQILGDASPGSNQDMNVSRQVAGAFAELNLPLAQGLEAQLAGRYDRYQGVGGSFNPKLALRYEARPELLLRASAGTGYRAPSLSDLYRPAREGRTATLADPVLCAASGGNLADCADNWPSRSYSNPALKPERSKQFSLGAVFEPMPGTSLSADYWQITKSDLISTIGEDVILGDLARYGQLVHRYNQPGDPNCAFDASDASICYVELRKANRGQQRSAGLDVVAEVKGIASAIGIFGARFSGTLMLQSEQQTASGAPFVSNLGRFVTDGVVQRWRHRLTLDWHQGDYSLSLANSYISGHEDQNNAIDTLSGSVVANNTVKAYSLWEVSGAWHATPQLTLRAGVQNLLNTAPPFSNQAYFFINGYDPSYTDPRGRFVYVSGQYRF